MNIINESLNELTNIRDEEIRQAATLINDSFKVLCVGNGGSSSTMTHLASDLMNLGYDAVCLTDNTARLTALTNDYGWGNLYRNMVKSHECMRGVVAVIASVNGSSGKSSFGVAWSQNLYDFAEFMRQNGGKVVSLVGNLGGELKHLSDVCISLSTKNPYVVEGCHSVLAHAICEELKEIKG